MRQRSPVTLETERLRLEPTKGEHAGALWNAIERSLPELRRWMSWAASTSPQRVSEFAQRAEAGWERWDNWEFVVVFDGEIVGSLGLNRYDEMWRTANLGYWIRSDVSGRGIATEAAGVVVRFAFELVDLNRLELVADVDNLASQRVAEKVGFQKEGIKREGTWIGGRGVDVFAYGLLASDIEGA